MTRDFLLLWQGQFISQMGSQAFILAVLYWLMQTTHSPLVMAAFMMAASLPTALCAPLGGVLADRVSKRRLIVWCDLLAGVAMLVAAFICVTTSSQVLQVWTLIVAAAVIASASGIFYPTVLAYIPQLNAGQQLPRANALIQSTEQGARALGFALGGGAIAVIGVPFLLLINGCSFLLSALSETLIKNPGVQPGVNKHKGLLPAAGLQYLRANKPLAAFFAMVLTFNFLYAPFLVFLPLHIQHHQLGGLAFGLLMSVYVLGQLGAFALVLARGARLDPKRWLQLSLLVCPLMLGALTLADSLVAKALLLMMQGVAMGMINVLLVSLLQKSTPGEVQGQVFGLLKLFAGLAMPLGMLLAALMTDWVSAAIDPIFQITSVAMLATVIAFTFGNTSYQQFLSAQRRNDIH